MNFRKVIASTGLVGALIFTSACSAPEAASPTADASPSTAASTASAAPTADTVSVKMPDGIVAKGVASDGVGSYLQTSISDDDPAMKYNPAIVDEAAKAHYSEEELAEAQKVVVKFIAEEAIDSTLNGGVGDIDVWWNAHKDQIHPLNHDIMLADMKKADTDVLARELWILERPGYSYAHGADTPRVTARTITPIASRYVESDNLQGVMIDTNVSYSMAVTKEGAMDSTQNSTGEISFAVAKDPADGKWKIAGYNTNYHTLEG